MYLQESLKVPHVHVVPSLALLQDPNLWEVSEHPSGFQLLVAGQLFSLLNLQELRYD